nr:MAG TPA: hypothetical protein [Caudoviricetes sp.]
MEYLYIFFVKYNSVFLSFIAIYHINVRYRDNSLCIK